MLRHRTYRVSTHWTIAVVARERAGVLEYGHCAGEAEASKAAERLIELTGFKPRSVWEQAS